MDLQKAFYTVDHQILLAKLRHYGTRVVSNDWFKSYLSNVSINGYDSGLAAINCGASKISSRSPAIFVIYK